MKVRLFRLFVVLMFIFSFVSCDLFKEEEELITTGSVTGTVTENGSNDPITAAEVTLSGISQSYKTGSDGKFEITDLPESNYTITVSKAGYVDNKKQASVRASYITNLDFSLEKDVPELKVSPSNIDFGADKEKMTLEIGSEDSKASIEWEIEKSQNATWLIISPEKGKTFLGKSVVTLTIDRTKMSADENYSTSIIVKSTNGGGSKSINVTANIESPKLKVTPSNVDFGVDKEKMTLEIENENPNATLQWEIEKPESATWVSISPEKGELLFGKNVVTLTINRSKMSADEDYSTSIIVKSNNGGGSKSINVTAKIEGANLKVEPSALNFGTNESEKTLLITNSTQIETLTYKTKANESWISIENGDGTISESETGTVKVTVSRLNLSAGNYDGTIVVESNKNTVTVNVSMEVMAKQAPTVISLQATEIKYNSINVSAYISSVGSAAVTDYGFCWGTSPQPTTDDNKNNLGGTSTSKNFNSIITGLTEETEYYIRAYAINEEGTSYSDAITIKTLSPPTMAVVRTFDVENIEYNKATGKGSIDDLGDGYVTAYGFCYSKTNSNPDLNDKVASFGSIATVGDFSGEITGLEAQTKYFVRAFATNSKGTAYGSSVEFTTPITPPLVTGGLIAYYTFDNENCDDYFGEENYSGILQGEGVAPTFTTDIPGSTGKAMKCTKGKYYYLPMAPDQSVSDYSYVVWVKTVSTGYIYKSIMGYDHKGTRLQFSENKIYYDYYSFGSTAVWFRINLDAIVFDGQWHHVVITKSGSERKLYVDGRYYHKETYGENQHSSSSYIGYDYNGKMDNLRIYNRALTQEEIKKLYDAKQ